MTAISLDPSGAALAAPPSGAGLSARAARFKRSFRAWWDGYYLEPEAPTRKPAAATAAPAPKAPASDWTAPRIRVAEMVWGDGFTYPGGADHALELVRPMSLDETKSALYMGCGLGGAVRTIVKHTGAWTLGLEASRSLATAGQKQSDKDGLGKKAAIEHFDPSRVTFKPRKYDAMCVRNVFSGVTNKKRLLGEIEKALRPDGHLVIHDFALSDPDASTPALHAWRVAEEVAPQPSTLAEMKRDIEGLKFDLRVADDVTDAFRAVVVKGWSDFAEMLSGKSLEPDEAGQLARELQLWRARLDAIESGALRVVRLYAIRALLD